MTVREEELGNWYLPQNLKMKIEIYILYIKSIHLRAELQILVLIQKVLEILRFPMQKI